MRSHTSIAGVFLALFSACSGSGVHNDPDAQPPTISLTSPAAGGVQGTVNLTATAEDNQGVIGVQFRLDDLAIGMEDTEAPYSIQWNTRDHADGQHTLTAVARDAAGNVGTSTPVVVAVSNAPPPTGSLRIISVTTGTHPDPDGYSVSVAGRQISVGTSDSVTASDIAAGTYSATLTGIASNCTTNSITRSVTVIADDTTDIEYQVTCSMPVGEIALTLADFVAYDLWLIRSDGTGLRQITQTGAPEVSPAWSPDGSKIAFSRVLSSRQIVVRTMASGSEVQLTNDAASNETPAWSPDGSKIAFARGLAGDYEIYVMGANGSGLVNLTNNAALDLEPAWSPDGSKIAFRSIRDGNWEIYVMNADGSAVIRLTNTAESESSPAWAPDGGRIAFASNRDGNQELYLMDPDGSNVVRLTNDPATDMDPSWESSGERIVFVRQGAQVDLWVMDADGANQVPVTNSTIAEGEPAWRPR